MIFLYFYELSELAVNLKVRKLFNLIQDKLLACSSYKNKRSYLHSPKPYFRRASF